MTKNPLLMKFILIFAVVGVAVAFGYPPKERINLGLDLRGGAHIMMQVETGSAVKYQIELATDRLGQRLKDDAMAYESILVTEDTVLEIRGTDPGRSSDVRKIIGEELGRWDVIDLGSGGFRVGMPQDVRANLETSAVDQTLSILRNRIDALGVTEPLVQKQGVSGDRILIQLPGVEDPGRVKRLLKDTDVLEWKAVSYPPAVTDFANWSPPASEEAVVSLFGGQLPPDTELYPQTFDSPGGTSTKIWWPLKGVSTVIGNDLRNAFRSNDEFGQAAVSFELSQEAGKRFEAATRENLGKRMAIVLGPVDKSKKYVLSAPTIQGVIRDQGIIQGNFSVTDAEDMALKLRSGAIPTEVSIIEERTVGPSLGRDSIRAGLFAGLVGFAGVLLFMVLYYRLSGINAVVALAMNILLIFGALGALPFLFAGVTTGRVTLTLPGIAGLILTVGLAVDSNVLIFERIREELRLGKTVRAAVDQGFGKAFLTIVDCNVTTVIAAVFLGMYGTGPVRGFAVTLIIGLIASMFTALFVSRQLFELVLSRSQRAQTLSI